jgi:hypothetical protein
MAWAGTITYYFAQKWVTALPESESWGLIRGALLAASGFVVLLVVLGVVLCLFAPREAGARGWRLLLPLCVAGLVAGAAALPYGVPEELFRPALGGLAFCGLVMLVSVMMMLRAFARARGDNQLGRNFVVWFIACLTQQLIRVSIFVSAREQIGDPGEVEFLRIVGGCWSWCDAALSLALFVWWVRLLWQLRDQLPWPPQDASARRA